MEISFDIEYEYKHKGRPEHLKNTFQISKFLHDLHPSPWPNGSSSLPANTLLCSFQVRSQMRSSFFFYFETNIIKLFMKYRLKIVSTMYNEKYFVNNMYNFYKLGLLCILKAILASSYLL